MEWLAVAAGFGIIAFAIFDIFETLLNPEDQGRLTNWISQALWTAFRYSPPALLAYAGPMAFVSVLILWATMLITGGALIYWPHLPDAFSFSGGIGEGAQTGFFTALYLSLVTLVTLGYGDITPTVTWLRLIGPLQAVIGFFMLTAAITWIQAIYEDFETRRTLAHETTLLRDALNDERLNISDLRPETVEKLIDQVTSRFVSVTGALNQFPITYYFRITDDRQSMAVMALFLLDLSEELWHESLPSEIRLRARMLSRALDHFAEVLRNRFLDVPWEASTRDVLEIYAEDHRRRVSARWWPGKKG